MKIADIMRRKPTIILGLNEESQTELELPADEYMATLTFQFEGDMINHDYHKRDACLSASVECHVTHQNGRITWHEIDLGGSDDAHEIYADNIDELAFIQGGSTHYRATIEQSTTPEQDAIIARVFDAIDFDSVADDSLPFTIEWI